MYMHSVNLNLNNNHLIACQGVLIKIPTILIFYSIVNIIATNQHYDIATYRDIVCCLYYMYAVS